MLATLMPVFDVSKEIAGTCLKYPVHPPSTARCASVCAEPDTDIFFQLPQPPLSPSFLNAQLVGARVKLPISATVYENEMGSNSACRGLGIVLPRENSKFIFLGIYIPYADT